MSDFTNIWKLANDIRREMDRSSQKAIGNSTLLKQNRRKACLDRHCLYEDNKLWVLYGSMILDQICQKESLWKNHKGIKKSLPNNRF